MGCPLVMGRKTWDSIGRPLPGRGSIVLTRNKDWQVEGAVAVQDFDAALRAAKSWIEVHNPECKKIILFGGGEIYRMGIDYCHQVDLTIIDCAMDGGEDAALFPKLNTNDWTRNVEEEFEPTNSVPGYRYERWQRNHPPRSL